MKKTTIYLFLLTVVFAWACQDEDPKTLSYEEIYGKEYETEKNVETNGSFFIKKGANLEFTESERTETTALYMIKTTGTNPSFTTERISGIMNEDACVLSFMYKSDKEITPTICFDVTDPTTVATIGKLEETSDWKEYSWDLGEKQGLISTSDWGDAGSYFKITLVDVSGANIELKDLKFRERTASEMDYAKRGQWIKFSMNEARGVASLEDITTEEGGFNLHTRNTYRIKLSNQDNQILSYDFDRPFLPQEHRRIRFEYKSDVSFHFITRYNLPDYSSQANLYALPPTNGEWVAEDREFDITGGEAASYTSKPIQMVFWIDAFPAEGANLQFRGIHYYVP